jgi:hypothetical protein
MVPAVREDDQRYGIAVSTDGLVKDMLVCSSDFHPLRSSRAVQVIFAAVSMTSMLEPEPQNDGFVAFLKARFFGKWRGS